jgi:hypothetical protein
VTFIVERAPSDIVQPVKLRRIDESHGRISIQRRLRWLHHVRSCGADFCERRGHVLNLALFVITEGHSRTLRANGLGELPATATPVLALTHAIALWPLSLPLPDLPSFAGLLGRGVAAVAKSATRRSIHAAAATCGIRLR